MASGDSRGRVFIWAVKSQIIKLELEVNKAIYDIAWSSDGQRLVAVGEGLETFGKAFIWNTGNSIGDILGHSKTVLSADFRPVRPFRLVSGGEDQLINFYEGPPFKFTSVFDEHTRYVNYVKFSPNGENFVSVGADKSIFLFDGKTGGMIKQIMDPENGHKGSILCFSWNKDGTEILTSSVDKTCKIWSISEGKVVSTFAIHEKPTVSDQKCATLWLEDQLLTVSLRGDIAILDRNSPSIPKSIIQGHQARLSALETDWANKIVYTADCDGRVMKWQGGAGVELPSDHSDRILAIGVGGGRLYTACIDNSLDMTSNETTISSKFSGQPLDAVACIEHPDICYVLTTGCKLLVHRDGICERTLELSIQGTALCVSPDGTHAFVAGANKIVKVDLSTGGNEVVSKKHGSPVSAMDYSRDGRFYVSVDSARYIYVWDSSTNACMNSGWKLHSAAPGSVSFSPDSSRVVTSGLDGTIFVFNDLTNFDSKDRHTIEGLCTILFA